MCSGGHGFRHLVFLGTDGSHVLLVFGDVKLVGEVPLSEFGEPEGFRKRGQGHLEEAERINETDVIVFDF